MSKLGRLIQKTQTHTTKNQALYITDKTALVSIGNYDCFQVLTQVEIPSFTVQTITKNWTKKTEVGISVKST